MKKLLLIPLVAALCFAPVGCSTIQKLGSGTIAISEPTTTTIIVDAEKLELVSKDAFSTFLRLEKEHRVAYGNVSPKIHEFSVWLRTRVQDPYDVTPNGDPPSHFVPRDVAYLKSLHKATDEFRRNKSATNQANLMTAYKTLKSVYDDCRKYTTQITTGVKS